eukprot:15456412-Alexandrium_andersonii.AAC.1
MAAAWSRLSVLAFHMALPVSASFSGLRPMLTVWLWGGPAVTHWSMVPGMVTGAGGRGGMPACAGTAMGAVIGVGKA